MIDRPESLMLVISRNRSTDNSLVQRLRDLDLTAETWSLNGRSAAFNGAIQAVVIPHDEFALSELPSTVSQIRERSIAPILLVDATLPPETPPRRHADLPITCIPGEVSVSSLLQAIALDCELQSLQSEVTHYRQLLESAPVGVFEITDGKFTYVNDYLLQQLGYARAELIGSEFITLIAPEDRSRLLKTIESLPLRSEETSPHVYRILAADGRILVGEARSRARSEAGSKRIEGTVRDITQETRIEQLHRVVLDLTEVILAEEDIGRILQLVLDTIVKHCGFARAVLSLYDLSIPNPFEGPIYKILTSGLTDEQEAAVHAQSTMNIAERRQIFSQDFSLGPAQYIPHDRAPWSDNIGIGGNVTIEGWHPDDYLFIPLRGTDGVIGMISVDDPTDLNAPTIASVEPVALLARIAAIAVERVFKLNQLSKQAEQLHGLSVLGSDLSLSNNERELCEIMSRRVCDDMVYEFCGIWLHDASSLVLEAAAQNGVFPEGEMPQKGTKHTTEGLGLTRLAFRTAEPILVADLHKDARYHGTSRLPRSLMAIPINGRKGVLGVINVTSRKVAAFGNQDAEMLSTLASQLSTAITGLRRQAALSRINEFSHHLAGASTQDQAISSTLEFLASQFDFHISAILLAHDGDSLQVAGLHGPYEQDTLALGQTSPLGYGIAGQAALTKHYAIVPNVKESPHYVEISSRTCSELAVPILFSGNLLGVINIESPIIDFFDDEDRRLIEVVATHLAITLTNISSLATLREQAIRDPLTGLFNRHYFNSIIASELSRSDRYSRPLSLMMIDVDGFRAVNNRLGHLTGDVVLQNVANMLSAAVRDSDRVIRYGGDEFLILVPETDGHGDAQIIASRLRDSIGQALVGTGAERIGLSLGLSIGIYPRHPGETRTLEEILEEVDRRMYADKRERNKDHADDYRH